MSDYSELPTDLTEEDSWVSQLAQTIDSVESAGEIATFQRFSTFVNPGLKVQGNHLVPLPLNEDNARTLKNICQPLAAIREDGTAIGSSTPTAWELDAAQFELTNPEWPTFFDTILGGSAKGLDLPQLTAKPHKLLLHGPGSLPKCRKGLNPEQGMVGTLAVCLPSKHESADLEFSFESERCTFSTASASSFDLSSIAWLSEATHKMSEVTSGHRLMLT
ncbi:hypothetical protein ACHAPJ_001585 [Fusarium lateritium]